MSQHQQVTVTVAGESRTLCYTMAAFRRLRALGINLLTPGPEEQRALEDVTLLLPMLWAGLVDGDRAAYPTVEALEAVVMPSDLPTLLPAFIRAVTSATGSEVPSDLPLATGTTPA